jgi:hypothetical protein
MEGMDARALECDCRGWFCDGFQVIFKPLISILHFINSTHALKVATTLSSTRNEHAE